MIRITPQKHCTLCGAKGEVQYRDLHDCWYGVQGSWSFSKCTNVACGLWWLDPMPVEADIHLAYSRYFTHGAGGARSHETTRWQQRCMRAQNKILSRLQRARDQEEAQSLYLGSQPPGTVLEIGCGSGDNLARLGKMGWKTVGQDVDEKAAARARAVHGLEVYTDAVERLVRPETGFDAILMNHVFEHLYRPAELLAACRGLLAKNGRLVIVTPNTNSFGCQRFGQTWVGLDPPRHVFLWSNQTLARLLSQCGFLVERNFTSHAHDDVFIMHSLNFQRNGFYDVGATVDPKIEIQAKFIEMAAAMTRALSGSRNDGEECVLIAKHASGDRSI